MRKTQGWRLPDGEDWRAHGITAFAPLGQSRPATIAVQIAPIAATASPDSHRRARHGPRRRRCRKGRAKNDGGVRPMKLSSASVYSSGLSDEAQRGYTSSAPGCGREHARVEREARPVQGHSPNAEKRLRNRRVASCSLLQLGRSRRRRRSRLWRRNAFIGGGKARGFWVDFRVVLVAPDTHLSASLRPSCLRSCTKDSAFRRSSRVGPVAGPFSPSRQALVAARNCKFDATRPLGNAQHLAQRCRRCADPVRTSSSERPRRISTSRIMIGSNPSTLVKGCHHKLRDPTLGRTTLRLPHIRVETARRARGPAWFAMERCPS